VIGFLEIVFSIDWKKGNRLRDFLFCFFGGTGGQVLVTGDERRAAEARREKSGRLEKTNQLW